MKYLKEERKIKTLKTDDEVSFNVKEEVELVLSADEIIQSYKQWEQNYEKLKNETDDEWIKKQKEECEKLKQKLDELSVYYLEAMDFKKKQYEAMKDEIAKQKEKKEVEAKKE